METLLAVLVTVVALTSCTTFVCCFGHIKPYIKPDKMPPDNPDGGQ